jgi:hypothetical protein
MSVSVTGSKTVNNAVAPHLSAATLTTLLATPVESLTVAQFKQLGDVLSRVFGGGDTTKTIGSFLS